MVFSATAPRTGLDQIGVDLHRFLMPTLVLSPSTNPIDQRYFLGEVEVMDECPLPCRHCGGSQRQIGRFPAWGNRAFQAWLCPNCLHHREGNHCIQWLDRFDLASAVPVQGNLLWLGERRLMMPPERRHQHQNPWLKAWLEHGNELCSASMATGIQCLGWSTSLVQGIDPIYRDQPRSSRLLIQIYSDGAIDLPMHGLIKYFYCPLTKKTILDYELID